jgi:alkanesulfonate monooxygenase SsuD/methylene tetrahydromethanopterin reductase-like flavin-dependent oxidoreductase (luciferase family)
MDIGLTLPNRGVLLGVTTPGEMLELAETADRSGLFRSVWVGDSLLGKPRMESVSLLSGIAARTRHVRIGPACMASFVLRDPVLLAYQWASLDLLSGGRTVLVGCTGLVEQEGARIEGELYGLTPRDRVSRLIEWITLLKKLWTEDNVTFEGKHYRCTGITIEPKPVAKPRPPIWIANNAREDKPFAEWTPEDFALVERTHRRCARHADGWQTSAWDPKDLEFRIEDTLKKVREQGRDPETFECHLYHNINVNEDREAALQESQRFLEQYYVPTQFPRTFVDQWVATGSPKQCAERLGQLRDLGFTEVTLRITSWNQAEQYQRLVDEVLPLAGIKSAHSAPGVSSAT